MRSSTNSSRRRLDRQWYVLVAAIVALGIASVGGSLAMWVLGGGISLALLYSALRWYLRKRIVAACAAAEDRARAALAKQIAHDIRSPLTALTVVVPDLAQLSEEKRRLARGAIDRLDALASRLDRTSCREDEGGAHALDPMGCPSVVAAAADEGSPPIAKPKLPPIWDAILIDDDPLVHATWKIQSAKRGKALQTFLSPADFFSSVEALDRHIPVYIDYNLGEGADGESVAKRAHALGFTHLYLATGAAESVTPAEWVRGIIGKEPPW